MLQSIVDFGEILAREVMTPRPDIVAIKATETVAALRALFREQQYSRYPGVQREPRQHRRLRARERPAAGRGGEHGRTPGRSTLIRPAHVRPGDQARPGPAEGVPAQAAPARHRRRRIRRHGGAGDDRGSARGDRRRDPRRIRRRDRADRRRGPGRVRGQRARWTSTRSRSGSASTSSAKASRRSAATCCRHLGRVPGVGETFEVDDLTVEVLEAERRRIHKVRVRRKVHAASAGA